MTNTTLHQILIPMIVDGISKLNFDNDSFPEMEIGEDLFSIVAVRKELSVHSLDSAGSTHGCASRVHIDYLPKRVAAHNIDLQVRSAAAHIFITCHGGNDTAGVSIVNGDQCKIIVDNDAVHDSAEVTSSQPLHAQVIPAMGSMRLDADTVETRYKAYIDAINGRNMSQTLPAFCHDVIIHNGKSLPLVEYQKLMEDAQAVIPDLNFSIANSSVNVDKQLFAARLDFRGTPIGEFAGVTPLQGVEKEVRFSEIVFYWFRYGKIAQVVSLVDLVDYRRQVTGQT